MEIPEHSNGLEEFGQSETTTTSMARGATGPRTKQGKQRSKNNALKHGIFSRVVVLKGEPQAEFDSLLRGLRKDLQPKGTLEEVLVDKLAATLWRSRRLIIVEGARPQSLVDSFRETVFGEPTVPLLDLSLRYESALERALDRTLSQLERLQRIRNGQPVAPTLNVNVST